MKLFTHHELQGILDKVTSGHRAMGTKFALHRAGHTVTIGLKGMKAYPMTGSTPIQHATQVDPSDTSYTDDSRSPVFGADPIPTDLQQVNLANCWEDAPEIGLASRPSGRKFLRSILQPSVDASGKRIPGHWTNFLAVNGVYAAIDLTMMVGSVQNQIGPSGNIWPDLMEKAAVLLIGGPNQNYFSVLNYNVISRSMDFLGFKNVRSLANLANAIAAREAGGEACLATHAGVPTGVVQNHAYAYVGGTWEQPWASQYTTDDGTGIYRHYNFTQQQIINGSMTLYVCDPVKVDPILPIPLPESAPAPHRPPVMTPVRPPL